MTVRIRSGAERIRNMACHIVVTGVRIRRAVGWIRRSVLRIELGDSRIPCAVLWARIGILRLRSGPCFKPAQPLVGSVLPFSGSSERPSLDVGRPSFGSRQPPFESTGEPAADPMNCCSDPEGAVRMRTSAARIRRRAVSSNGSGGPLFGAPRSRIRTAPFLNLKSVSSDPNGPSSDPPWACKMRQVLAKPLLPKPLLAISAGNRLNLQKLRNNGAAACVKGGKLKVCVKNTTSTATSQCRAHKWSRTMPKTLGESVRPMDKTAATSQTKCVPSGRVTWRNNVAPRTDSKPLSKFGHRHTNGSRTLSRPRARHCLSTLHQRQMPRVHSSQNLS